MSETLLIWIFMTNCEPHVVSQVGPMLQSVGEQVEKVVLGRRSGRGGGRLPSPPRGGDGDGGGPPSMSQAKVYLVPIVLLRDLKTEESLIRPIGCCCKQTHCHPLPMLERTLVHYFFF
jgi:hypothetical protein